MMSRRDRILLIFLFGIALIAIAYAAGHAQSPAHRSNEWIGLTDNQGNTATVTGGQLVVTVVPPTPTPTP